jgi:protein phosphatase methylesterase 1
VAVLDVVEGIIAACPRFLLPALILHSFFLLPLTGSALEALPHMHSLLNARPDGFDSPEEAIEWQYVLSLVQLI